MNRRTFFKSIFGVAVGLPLCIREWLKPKKLDEDKLLAELLKMEGRRRNEPINDEPLFTRSGSTEEEAVRKLARYVAEQLEGK